MIKALGCNEITTYISSDNSSKEDCDSAEGIFQPLAFDNTPKPYDGQWDIYNKREDVNSSNMWKHLTNKKRVFELMVESGKDFDVYVCCRADLYFFKQLSLLIDDALHVPDFNDFFGLNDQLAWGGRTAMLRYTTLLDRVIDINQSFGNDHSFNPEILNKRNVEFLFPVNRHKKMYCFKCSCSVMHQL